MGRKQTLTYLKGYPQQDPDVSGLMSYDGAARSAHSPKIASHPLVGSGGSSLGASAEEPGSPANANTSSSPLPKWVEQDRQVRHAATCYITHMPALFRQHSDSAVELFAGRNPCGYLQLKHQPATALAAATHNSKAVLC